MSTFHIILLAAGRGTRMNNPELPKVLFPILGKPMIHYSLESIQNTQIPVSIIVGFQAEKVQHELGNKYNYILQDNPQGTGHAVAVCKPKLNNQSDNIIVLYADMPLIQTRMILDLVKHHETSHATMTMATINVDDFSEWKQGFYGFGRIVRDETGKLQEIVELKNATDEQKNITELNPSYFCFKSSWLWENIDHLTNQNPQGEYLLTDLLARAVSQNQLIESLTVDPLNAIGVNTPEQLTIVENLLKNSS